MPRRAPHAPLASVQEATRSSPTREGLTPAARTPEQAVAAAAQDSAGNLRVQAALSGAAGDGHATSLLADLSAASAGLDLGGLGGGSNQTMLRRLRAHQAGAQAVDLALVGQGEALPEAVRARMEAALGHDFGHARIHRGGAGAVADDALWAWAGLGGS